MPRLYQLLILAVLFACNTGCVSTVKKKLDFDTELTLNFIMSHDGNPDDNRRASPVFTRLYQLRDAHQFENLGFIELYEQDLNLLGNDVIHKVRLKEFVPGEKRSLHYKLDLATEQVALFAEFIQYQHSQNRLVLPIQARSQNTFTILITNNQLKLVNSD